jgi:hypothetical protein
MHIPRTWILILVLASSMIVRPALAQTLYNRPDLSNPNVQAPSANRAPFANGYCKTPEGEVIKRGYSPPATIPMPNEDLYRLQQSTAEIQRKLLEQWYNLQQQKTDIGIGTLYYN